MVGTDGLPPLPWLAEPLRRALATQRGHAVLLHGPQGVGQFELSVALAQAWLCEAHDDLQARPCGRCASCRLVQAHSHPDLRVFVPEALQDETGWGAEGDDGAGAGRSTSKARPSREIKVEAVRAAVAFAQTTSSRGLAKVVVLHPAERMNAVSANTLLKTLEEPPGAARFVLSAAAPDALLPTIRSRCQAFALGVPPREQALAWLAERGVDDAAVLLAAAGGQPLEALAWSRDGIDAARWTGLPAQVRRGDAAGVAGWPPSRTIDALQKLCHDLACVGAGAAPRYFPAATLRRGGGAAALVAWMAELNRAARHAEHPWNAALLADALVRQGQRALAAA